MSRLTSGERTFLIAVGLVTVLGTAIHRIAKERPAWFPGFSTRSPDSAAPADSTARAAESTAVGNVLASAPFSGRPTLLEAQIARVAAAIDEAERSGKGRRGAAGTGGAPAPVAPLDPNVATAEELEALPGIGPVLAGRIVSDRETNGRFKHIGELERVPGIGPRTLTRLAPYFAITAGEAPR